MRTEEAEKYWKWKWGLNSLVYFVIGCYDPSILYSLCSDWSLSTKYGLGILIIKLDYFRSN